jgi:hypothetical protein
MYHIHNLPLRLVFHIAPKKDAIRLEIRRTRRPRNWSSSSYRATKKIHVQIFNRLFPKNAQVRRAVEE